MSLIVKIPNSQKADHETPGLDQNGLVFKSPTTSIWVGSTGAGKTMAAANAIAHQAKWRKFDHIFLMSPNVDGTASPDPTFVQPVLCLRLTTLAAHPKKKMYARVDCFFFFLSVQENGSRQSKTFDHVSPHSRPAPRKIYSGLPGCQHEHQRARPEMSTVDRQRRPTCHFIQGDFG
jgi:hypothetical protein